MNEMRQINWDAPLSEEDIEWLRMSGQQRIEDRIEENRRRFAPEEEDDADEDETLEDESTDDDDADDDEADDYDELTVTDLKAELDRRGLEYAPKSTKQVLIDALRADDEK